MDIQIELYSELLFWFRDMFFHICFGIAISRNFTIIVFKQIQFPSNNNAAKLFHLSKTYNSNFKVKRTTSNNMQDQRQYI